MTQQTIHVPFFSVDRYEGLVMVEASQIELGNLGRIQQGAETLFSHLAILRGTSGH